MKLKSLLLGSAATLIAASGANASDMLVADPESVEYVRVCDAYGAGYFYIPGTQTCMRISGYVRSDVKFGDNPFARKRNEINRDTYAWRTRATLNFSTASDTELGTLRSFIQLRSQWDAGAEYGNGHDAADGQVRFAYIELGGFRFGMDESIFNHWTGYFGNVINDDVNSPFAYNRTNVLSYTFSADNGFAGIIGVEQGTGTDDKWGTNGNRNSYVYANPSDEALISDYSGRRIRAQTRNYTPNVLAGVKFVQGWGGASFVAAYDAYYEEWAAKLRLDVNVTDELSLWAMIGYKTGDDYYDTDKTYFNDGHNGRKGALGVYRTASTMYGDWGGDWAIWGGGTYRFSPQTSFNFQASYDDVNTLAVSANVRHELVRGLSITPEATYISWDDDYGFKANYDGAELVKEGVRSSLKGKNAFQGMVRVQRSF